jgi:DNA-binding transcriptional regulator YiaG
MGDTRETESFRHGASPPGETLMTAGELRLVLVRLDLTQARAAALLGCATRTVRHWASGDRSITASATILLRLLVRDVVSVADIESAHSAH